MSVNNSRVRPQRQVKSAALGTCLPTVSWSWWFAMIPLVLIVLLPTAALIVESATRGPLEFWQAAISPTALAALSFSVFAALCATSVNLLFSVLIAWVLARYDFPLKRIIDAAIDLPFVFPSLIGGLELTAVYSDNGWVGSLLTPLGIKVAFTPLGVVLAMIYVSMPVMIRTVQATLSGRKEAVEEAASSLGASQWQTFWSVVLPSLLPAIVTGVALGFLRAIGEFGSTIIISSNTPYKDLTAPVLIFQHLENGDVFEAAVIGTELLGVVLLAISVINFLHAWRENYDL